MSQLESSFRIARPAFRIRISRFRVLRTQHHIINNNQGDLFRTSL